MGRVGEGGSDRAPGGGVGRGGCKLKKSTGFWGHEGRRETQTGLSRGV